MPVVLFLLALLGLARPVAVAADELPLVSGIRFGTHGQRTRIVVQFDRPVAFTTVTLPDPPRLVVDLPDVRWQTEDGRLGRPRGLVTGQRHGRYAEGVSRLVLDLAQPYRIADQFTLPGKAGDPTFRVVVDVEPAPAMVVSANSLAAPPDGTADPEFRRRRADRDGLGQPPTWP